MKDGISKVGESDSMQEYIGVVAKKTKMPQKKNIAYLHIWDWIHHLYPNHCQNNQNKTHPQ